MRDIDLVIVSLSETLYIISPDAPPMEVMETFLHVLKDNLQKREDLENEGA